VKHHLEAARLCEFLAPSEAPRAADALFVFAGRPERKRYGVALWRRGLAPTLILSVGRFEWRRFPELGLPDDGGLRALVEATYYKRRHFFVTVGPEGARASFVEPARLGTWREAIALAREARTRGFRSLLVVSTSIHLRRARLALSRALGGLPVEVTYTAVPEDESSFRCAGWWRSGAGRLEVAAELFKLAAYRLLLPWFPPRRERRGSPGG